MAKKSVGKAESSNKGSNLRSRASRVQAGKKAAETRGYDSLAEAGRKGAKARSHESRVAGGIKAAQTRGYESLAAAGRKGGQARSITTKNRSDHD